MERAAAGEVAAVQMAGLLAELLRVAQVHQADLQVLDLVEEVQARAAMAAMPVFRPVSVGQEAAQQAQAIQPMGAVVEALKVLIQQPQPQARQIPPVMRFASPVIF